MSGLLDPSRDVLWPGEEEGNSRWEFINGRHVNVCRDCGKECGDETLWPDGYPNMNAIRNIIRCGNCADIARKKWFR